MSFHLSTGGLVFDVSITVLIQLRASVDWDNLPCETRRSSSSIWVVSTVTLCVIACKAIWIPTTEAAPYVLRHPYVDWLCPFTLLITIKFELPWLSILFVTFYRASSELFVVLNVSFSDQMIWLQIVGRETELMQDDMCAFEKWEMPWWSL